MKKSLLYFSFLITFFATKAQSPEDILKYSYFPQQGTARNMAVGSAMASLGGDLNALFVNPAGLAMYKTKEWVVSSGYNLNKNKANFRGTANEVDKNGYSVGTLGLVIGYNDKKSKWNNQAFSIGFAQVS